MIRPNGAVESVFANQIPNEMSERISCRPFSIPNPLGGCNSDLAQYSITPSLRAAGFEDGDEEEDENEAPGEGGSMMWIYLGLKPG